MRVRVNGQGVNRCYRCASMLLALSLQAWCLESSAGGGPPPNPEVDPHLAETPLLPRELLFGPAQHAVPLLSPDGKRLTFLAPTGKGVANIWLAKGLDITSAEPLTQDVHRGIQGYRWAYDGVHLLYWQDNDGDENWHLYTVNLRTGKTQDLTPYPGVRMQNLLMSSQHPHEVLIGLNRRSRMVFDMYRVNLDDGSSTLEATNPGDVLSWTADADFVIRAATAFIPDTGMTGLRVRDKKEAPWRDLASWSFEESVFTGQVNGGAIVASFAKDGRSVYAVSTTGSDHSRLVNIDVATGREQTVAGDNCDVAEDDGYTGSPGDLRPLVLQSPAGDQPDAVAMECMERTWHVLNPARRADLQLLQKQVRGFPYIISRDRADEHWIIASVGGDHPIEYSRYDRKSKHLTSLFSEHPDLAKQSLPRPVSFEITARDGLKIPVYLTRPAGTTRSPLVLYPHGGPWFRDHDEFDPVVQLLVNRGYAVLQPQYRGSTGFGKTYLNAGNHEYGLKMRDDLLDAVDWAVREGYADPQRIGVFGFSAGGYLSLRVTEARPELFRATVDVVGPTDVAGDLATFPPNWAAVKARWVRRIGDAEHDPNLNRLLSPRFEDKPISGRLFVAQGANDVRVSPKLANDFVERLRKRGASVTYVVYTDEGHSFVRPENNLDFFGRVEEFLAQRLGGRAEPWQAQPGARVEIK